MNFLKLVLSGIVNLIRPQIKNLYIDRSLQSNIIIHEFDGGLDAYENELFDYIAGSKDTNETINKILKENWFSVNKRKET